MTDAEEPRKRHRAPKQNRAPEGDEAICLTYPRVGLS
jgi:hypothetical protein